MNVCTRPKSGYARLPCERASRDGNLQHAFARTTRCSHFFSPFDTLQNPSIPLHSHSSSIIYLSFCIFGSPATSLRLIISFKRMVSPGASGTLSAARDMMRFRETPDFANKDFNMDTNIKQLGQDMDGIRIDSAVATDTSSLNDHDMLDTDMADADAADSSILYEPRLTSNKGYGLFATRDIPRGTCIVEEPALVRVPHSVAKNGPGRAIVILHGIETLTLEQMDKYNDLHSNFNTVDPNMRAAIKTYLIGKQYSGPTIQQAFKDHLKMAAIFNTNAVMLETGGGLGSAVFATYSRANQRRMLRTATTLLRSARCCMR